MLDQELISFPLVLTKVEIVPLINTPNKEPSTFPTPPVSKCTTDDCGGNSVHFKAGCLGGGTCHGIQAVADSADGSKETGKDICLHLVFLTSSPIRVADC